MTSDADTVALLECALDQTAGLIAAIEPGQAGLATPCAGWDVRALVSHLAGQDLRNFLVAVRGEAADWQAPAEDIGDDWAAAFRDRAVPVPDDAPVYDRLAGWFGRDPDWTSPGVS
ncbi:MAG: maleylpyruvate isomerase N-terminal domain-containing protein [Streptosporangiaceae bacterium]